MLHSHPPRPVEDGPLPGAYLDWAASAPLARSAVEAMARVMAEGVGNPSSVHRAGRRARRRLEEARDAVAQAVGATAAEIVFTSGGTEADNLAVVGGARAAVRRGRGRHVVVSALEHAAVLESAHALTREGFEVSVAPCGASGVVEVESLQSVLRADTALVAVMAANNEVGTVQPVVRLAEATHQVGALFFTDAVQAVGQLAVDVREWGADLLALSAHKVGGPQGAGALYCRAGVDIAALLHGGGQEAQRRAGTENVVAAVGLGTAVAEAASGLSGRVAACEAVQRRVVAGCEGIPGVRLVGREACRVSHVATFVFEGAEAETLLFALDLAGVAASSGAACSSGSLEPSHVLLAMGLGAADARSAVRFSWGPATRDEEVRHLLAVLPGVVERNRAVGGTSGRQRSFVK